MSRSAAFSCDLSGEGRPFPHFWEHTVGSGHAPLALRADWQEQMARCRRELGFRHVRFHGILSDDVGTLVEEEGQRIDSFFNAEQIWDFLLSVGMRPFVELSFMPLALASGRKTVFRYRGNVTPPRSQRQWAELIRRFAGRAVERYGREEVRTWPFEVWNEPNLKAFWTGTRAEYFRLYRETARAIKAVDTSLKVGGPATARNAWIEEFLEFCENENAPLDFVSTHHYPTDDFGKPGDDTVSKLARSRRGVLTEQARGARRKVGARPLFYTEWSSSSNPFDPLHDEPYAAAFAIKTILETAGLVDAYSWWTFSDIFEENYFSSVPFHGGFGLLTLHGIAKPVYRAFELLHRLGDELLPVQGSHPTVDAWVARRGRAATLVLTNWELPRHAIRAERARVTLSGARPAPARLERIDEDHGHARPLWEEMGRPDSLTSRQAEDLHAASTLEIETLAPTPGQGGFSFELSLPPNSVAAVEFGEADS